LPTGFSHRMLSVVKSLEGSHVSLNMFDKEQNFVRKSLRHDFVKFMATKEYTELSPVVDMKSDIEDREIQPFDANMVPVLMLKIEGSTKEKEVMIKKDVFTVGRDKSNNLVLDDDRVSRSHARFEYNKTQCEFIDLGSLKGSELNGKSVQRARLAPGDVITLGHSQLTFTLKKKGFSLF